MGLRLPTSALQILRVLNFETCGPRRFRKTLWATEYVRLSILDGYYRGGTNNAARPDPGTPGQHPARCTSANLVRVRCRALYIVRVGALRKKEEVFALGDQTVIRRRLQDAT